MAWDSKPVPHCCLLFWTKKTSPRLLLGCFQKKLEVEKHSQWEMHPQPKIDLMHWIICSLQKISHSKLSKNPSKLKKTMLNHAKYDQTFFYLDISDEVRKKPSSICL
jgi:hypothetical protein